MQAGLWNRHGGLLSALIVFVGIPVVIVLALALTGNLPGSTAPGPGVAPANVPPVGSIWFGRSFDTTTFAISGQTDSAGTNEALSYVAHLTRVMNGSDLNVRVSLNGSVISNAAVKWNGAGEIWGSTIGPLTTAGTWKIQLLDIGGNVLASGSVTVR